MKKKLGNRLKKLRTGKNMTQKQLAIESGVSHSYISYIERGQADTTILILLRLARGLKIKTSQFF